MGMMKVKWDVDGKGEEAWGGGGDTYTGPTPPKGSYIAKIKRITMSKIKSEGVNKGKPRLSILLEVISGQGAEDINDENYKYRGAPIWDGVNIIKAQAGRANAFVHALTDGSDKAKRAVEDKFWPPNMDVRAEKQTRRDGTEDIHIKKIGPYNINSPQGEIIVRITTKVEPDLQGNPRATVQQYLPYTGPMPDGTKTKSDDDDEDLLDMDADDDDGDLDDDGDDLDDDDTSPDEPF